MPAIRMLSKPTTLISFGTPIPRSARRLRTPRAIRSLKATTAVIAFNDLMALGVLSRLADRGIGVPNEISVVGFDNILMAGMATPQLTTVALPLEQAGRVAIELLLEQLAQPGSGTHEQGLPAQLIVRASTAPPRSGVRSGLRAMRTEPLQETTAIAESR